MAYFINDIEQMEVFMNNKCIEKRFLVLILIIAFLSVSATASAWCFFNCVPIKVTFYDDKSGHGLTATFHNVSDKHIAVRVAFENNTLNQGRYGYMEFSPDQTIDIGWRNTDWKFMSGETVTISHEDYKTVVIKVP